ncbi:MAG TPA: DUF3883 domain-containing protein [Arenimonas sp.]|nr:DUF3883 domain-containing protein [Arenimonas sp.]HOZ04846.1 DUF3883 domain-containing protein [Arenimonas sp.]HPW31538.1 DUF3883 domain-containing protein [Arenimonas sp.]
MSIEEATTGSPWTKAEVKSIVEAYFRMLRMQELGQQFNKAEINRQLQKILPERNLSSIEYKHRNISAVLNLFGAQAVSGYKPLSNFQHILVDIIGEELEQDRVLDDIALRSVQTLAETPTLNGFDDFIVGIPKPNHRINEKQVEWIQRTAIKRDYLEREAKNRSLGLAGEFLVMEYEARRLHDGGAKSLADRIDHVSQSKGDGAGFDILSFDLDGRERFIEVKTTAYYAETPFFITPNEIKFSREYSNEFYLYRLFSFRKKPQMFSLPGPVEANCYLDPINYRATLIGQ